MGKATLTTDSSAMRDYITDGVNGVLVPPRAPAVMAELIRALLTDGNHRHSIGLAAAETVRERFGLEQMWKCVIEAHDRRLHITERLTKMILVLSLFVSNSLEFTIARSVRSGGSSQHSAYW